MLNAHFTRFAQRFAYLQVTAVNVVDAVEKSKRQGCRKREADGRWKERDLFFLHNRPSRSYLLTWSYSPCSITFPVCYKLEPNAKLIAY